MPRYVKLGRKPLSVGVGHHWAVRVETSKSSGCWFEILGKSGDEKSDSEPNDIGRSYTSAAKSGAGALGGSTVGKTTKSDEEIDDFISRWLSQNPTYGLYAANCQKFATEFIAWLTDDNYNIKTAFDAGKVETKSNSLTHAIAHDGTAYACASFGEGRGAIGPFSSVCRLPTAQAGVSVGTEGLYAVAEASAIRLESNYGNVVGAHLDVNVNTGLGIRNGNAEAHLLGFGGRVGTDGVEVNTPLGGVRIPALGAPINWVVGWFR